METGCRSLNGFHSSDGDSNKCAFRFEVFLGGFNDKRNGIEPIHLHLWAHIVTHIYTSTYMTQYKHTHTQRRQKLVKAP